MIQIPVVPRPIYNRGRRVYELTGVDMSFPAGDAGRALAFRTAIHLFAPELHEVVSEVVERYPEMERRAWKAANCVLSGGVRLVPDLNRADILALVDASDGMGGYAVRHYEGGGLCCECEDFVGFGAPLAVNGQRYCYHLLAYRFFVKLYANQF